MSHLDLINKHIQNIRSLQTPRGLFLASEKGVSTGYDKPWLRDNFYTALAFEVIEDWETVHKVYRAILDIFLKHEYKIEWAAEHKPFYTWQHIHARYNPESFEEYWEEWGNKQHDAVGAILFKLGDLAQKGHSVIETDDDRRIVQKLVDYSRSIEYWHDPDSGMWEEDEELHSSSLAAMIAGLKSVDNAKLARVHEGLIIKGEEALHRLLPRESQRKFADLAQLSLYYPYRVVSGSLATEILENIEYHLVKQRGIIRYKGDRYYNKNRDNYSEEAEWVFGFPWLSIIYAEMNNKEKAHFYLEKSKECISHHGKLPELYYSNSEKPNENIPLGWTESMFVLALDKFDTTFNS